MNKGVSMNKEIVEVSSDPFMEMMERVATNESIDADKMQKILDMQMQVMDREARNEFYNAMNRVQMTLPAVVANCDNKQTNSKYANIKAIALAIKPIYTKEGFSISFGEADAKKEKHIRIEGLLRHKDGHSESYHDEVPLDMTGIKGSVNKTDTHGTGSTFTYGRRYLTCMIFDVATGDDTDGNIIQTTISDEQVANLEALMDETDTKKSDFMKFCKVSVLDDILSRSYQQAVAALEAKRV